jgi:hypothetical protein
MQNVTERTRSRSVATLSVREVLIVNERSAGGNFVTKRTLAALAGGGRRRNRSRP